MFGMSSSRRKDAGILRSHGTVAHDSHHSRATRRKPEIRNEK